MYARDFGYYTEAQEEVPNKGARRKPRALMVERDQERVFS